MNPLDSYPGIRKVLYLIQWLVNGVIGVLGIVFTAQGQSPAWYVLTVACLAFVWTYAGITAQTNVDSPAPVRNEGGYIDLGGDDEESTSDPEPEPEPDEEPQPQRRPYEESH